MCCSNLSSLYFYSNMFYFFILHDILINSNYLVLFFSASFHLHLELLVSLDTHFFVLVFCF